MKLFKKSLLLVSIIIISALQYSCEENESGLNLIGLEARFIGEVDNRTVIFNNLSNDAVSFEWNFGDGETSTVENPTKTYDADGTFTVTLTVTSESGETDTFQDTFDIELILIQNGDFENGSTAWIQGVNDNAPAPIVTVDGNTFYEVNVTNPNPAAPFLVNLSQKIPIEQGNTYVLKFDAWSDADRSVIAGIGLSGGDFSNDVQTVEITDVQTQYEITLSSENFGAPDARVLFDSNGEAGFVRIDNVSLELQ